MNEPIQNIIVFILFIYAIWSLVQHFSSTLKSDGCSSACGSCSNNNKDLKKIRVKKLKI
jgi:hypothetical protein